jgi:hypothetical protein
MSREMFEEIKADEEMIERLIDKVGICIFLQTIAYICDQKSEHIAVNWQDASLAKRWDKVADKINIAAENAFNL